MTSTLGIVLTFIILGSVLLYNLIYTSIHWLVKFLSITVTIYFSLVTFFSLEDLKGWPIETILPKSFLLISVNIQEPSIQDEKGGIYLWCRDLSEYSKEDQNFSFYFLKPFFEFKKTSNKPRNYEFKYNKKFHEKLSEVEEMIKQGKMIVGQNKGSKNNKDRKSSKDGNLENKGYEERDFEYDIKFYELPPIKLPEKIIQ